MMDKSTMMMGVRGMLCPPITIHSVKAQKVKIYMYLGGNIEYYEVNNL
jgi:hypothetical protein